jgi:hypothetical protein
VRPRATTGRAWICCACAAVAVAAPPAAAEADAERGTSNPSSEGVPEFDAYVKLTKQARLFLLADVARLTPDDVTNGEVG